MDFGRYSKLVGALLGNAIAILLAYIAVQFPSISECRMIETTEVCTVLGFSQAQITGALMAIFNSYFVYQFPANKPPA